MSKIAVRFVEMVKECVVGSCVRDAQVLLVIEDWAEREVSFRGYCYQHAVDAHEHVMSRAKSERS